MTVELLKIFDESRKTPLEDRLNQVTESFENMFSLFLEVTDRIDNKLISLQEQINSLEARFRSFEKETTKYEIEPLAFPPTPSPTSTNEHPENLRRELMNELRDLLEKRNKKIDENQE